MYGAKCGRAVLLLCTTVSTKAIFEMTHLIRQTDEFSCRRVPRLIYMYNKYPTETRQTRASGVLKYVSVFFLFIIIIYKIHK